MRRLTILFSSSLVVAAATTLVSCTLFNRIPEDDPSTPNINEREVAEAAIADAEAQLAASAAGSVLLPPPFNWIIPSGAALLITVAAGVRNFRKSIPVKPIN